MDLKFEKNVKVSVEIDGKPFIKIDEGIFYQNIKDKEAFFYIKNTDENKEIKIKFLKDDNN